MKTFNYEQRLIIKAAANYLSEDSNEELYDAYLKLKEAAENGKGDEPAMNYAIVWQPLEYDTVETILDLIESSFSNMKQIDENNPIRGIDWEMLRKQKETLLGVITYADKNIPLVKDDLEGILNLIDNIQDYAKDVLNLDVKFLSEDEEE